MGELYAKYLYKIENPRLGLLSVGGEDIKGCALTKESFKIIEKLPVNFVGNVEANTIFEGAADVLISDGFAGNVLLKGAEGLAKSTMFWLKKVLKKNAFRLIWAMLAQNAFRELKAYGDADEIGGAPLLGVNGVCIIGHGSSNPKAVFNAIRVAGECVKYGLNDKIVAKIKAAGIATGKTE
jgi:glycerol-3-phosphate acyltransferase PlsX